MAGDHGGTKAIIAAFLANLGIAVAKLVGFVVTGAASMLAESIHSLADSGNQGLLLLGSRRAKRAADREHPFGYGTERYFWAFVVALVLFTLGSLFSLYEGIEKLSHPHELESISVAVGILGVAILLEGYSFRTAIVEANKVRDKRSWWQFIRHSKSPELPVVLLEDAGALLGLVLALLGVLIAQLTHEPRWDAVGSISIGVLLGVIAIVLAVEMKSLLIGEGASPTDEDAIATAIVATPQVTRLIHMKTMHLGPDELLVAAKLALSPALSLTEVATAIDAAEANVRAAVPAARLIYLEPDLYRPEVTAS
jgi:cation diffusion facilitator family transporter